MMCKFAHGRSLRAISSVGLRGGVKLTNRVWCQWCLGTSHTHHAETSNYTNDTGHTSHSELVSFLRRAKAALRDETSLIIVKENTCEDGVDGAAKEFLDEEDSSLTRYVAIVFSGLTPCYSV
jgi:protein N-terminal methyltransferase